MNFQSVEFEAAAGRADQLKKSDLPEIVFSGKSNVGKSSLINKLVNRKALARVSATPGKTATINFFRLPECRFVDLPGYGYAKVSAAEKEKWGKMIEGYLHNSKELRAVFLLVDIRHEPTRDDVAMAQYFRQMGILFTVVATKADKISRGARMKQIAPICRALLVQPWEVIAFSSEDFTGRDALLARVGELMEEDGEGEE